MTQITLLENVLYLLRKYTKYEIKLQENIESHNNYSKTMIEQLAIIKIKLTHIIESTINTKKENKDRIKRRSQSLQISSKVVYLKLPHQKYTPWAKIHILPDSRSSGSY